MDGVGGTQGVSQEEPARLCCHFRDELDDIEGSRFGRFVILWHRVFGFRRRAMSKPRDHRHKDLFRPSLDEIIDLGHPLARLGQQIDWDFLDRRFASVCASGSGQPPLSSRLVAGLLILKHMHDLSDEVLCARWVENPYYQYFCGEESFCHALVFDRSSLTRWRQRLGEEHLLALLQESLSVAHKSGALATKDLERVVVDTTVQPKNLAFPTDAKLTHKAIVMLGRLARTHDVPLRQSYVRVAKRAAIMAGRYAHAKQFKRHNRELRFWRTRLGGVNFTDQRI